MLLWGKVLVDWTNKKAAVQPIFWPKGNLAWGNATLGAEAPKPICHSSNGCIAVAGDSRSFRQISLTVL